MLELEASAACSAGLHRTSATRCSSTVWYEPTSRQVWRFSMHWTQGPSLPGVPVFHLDDPSVTTWKNVHSLAVGVFQLFWNYPLEEYPVTSLLEIRQNLEHEIRQLVSVMRAHLLKYGLLSTYRYAVFVRRIGLDRFELSLPVHEEAASPSVRECMAEFCAIVANDSEAKFQEPSDFNEQILLSPST